MKQIFYKKNASVKPNQRPYELKFEICQAIQTKLKMEKLKTPNIKTSQVFLP